MRTFILIGWSGADIHVAKPQCLYCGQDGVELMEKAEKARQSGKFVRLGKLVNPSIVPLPPAPDPKPAK